MRAKPNTDQFKPAAKNPADFLEGGAADRADAPIQNTLQAVQPAPAPTYTPVPKVYREQKVFRLPQDVIDSIKRAAFEQSMGTGIRVTETELVEKALRAYFMAS